MGASRGGAYSTARRRSSDFDGRTLERRQLRERRRLQAGVEDKPARAESRYRRPGVDKPVDVFEPGWGGVSLVSECWLFAGICIVSLEPGH